MDLGMGGWRRNFIKNRDCDWNYEKSSVERGLWLGMSRDDGMI